jgi:hypothetical protein
MRMLKKLTQITGTVLRLTIGIGGAAMVFLALKDKNRKGPSERPKPKF